MSIQHENGVSVKLLAEVEQQHLRLLELPPELLALLTSTTPERLELKATGSSSDDSGHAVLCSATKTWTLRQKNSSNSVYLLHPGLDDDRTLEAIAQCHSTLELTPSESVDVASQMISLLPSFSSTSLALSGSQLTKQQLFDQTPASQDECETACRSLAVFEHPTTGSCLLPSAQAKLNSWKESLDIAASDGHDLTQPLATGEVLSLCRRESDIETAVAMALLHSIGEMRPNGDLRIQPEHCVRSIGLAHYQTLSNADRTNSAAFVASWQDLLPEKWRELVTPSAVETVASLAQQSAQQARSDGRTGPAIAKIAETTGSKRKWHDKFRTAR